MAEHGELWRVCTVQLAGSGAEWTLRVGLTAGEGDRGLRDGHIQGTFWERPAGGGVMDSQGLWGRERELGLVPEGAERVPAKVGH